MRSFLFREQPCGSGYTTDGEDGELCDRSEQLNRRGAGPSTGRSTVRSESHTSRGHVFPHTCLRFSTMVSRPVKVGRPVSVVPDSPHGQLFHLRHPVLLACAQKDERRRRRRVANGTDPTTYPCHTLEGLQHRQGNSVYDPCCFTIRLRPFVARQDRRTTVCIAIPSCRGQAAKHDLCVR